MKRHLLLTILLLTFFDFAQSQSYSCCDGFIMGTNVRFRTESNLQGKIVGTLSTGEYVSIIDETEERVVLNADDGDCGSFGYRWYKIETLDDETGWVYGQFLFLRASVKDNGRMSEATSAEKMLGIEYYDGKENFYFDVLVDNGKGVMDEDGLTGCSGYMVPLFYKSEKAEGYFIHCEQDILDKIPGHTGLGMYKGQGPFCMEINEGISSDIREIYWAYREGERSMVMEIETQNQDGGSISYLYMTFRDNHFEVTDYWNSGRINHNRR